jgi:hypothetical protein
MIYLVTNSPPLIPYEGIELLSIEESLNLIKDWEIIQVDTETTGGLQNDL